MATRRKVYEAYSKVGGEVSINEIGIPKASASSSSISTFGRCLAVADGFRSLIPNRLSYLIPNFDTSRKRPACPSRATRTRVSLSILWGSIAQHNPRLEAFTNPFTLNR